MLVLVVVKAKGLGTENFDAAQPANQRFAWPALVERQRETDRLSDIQRDFSVDRVESTIFLDSFDSFKAARGARREAASRPDDDDGPACVCTAAAVSVDLDLLDLLYFVTVGINK